MIVPMTAQERHVLVVGASGVIGSSAVEAFAERGWTVTAISRRRPTLDESTRFAHISVDLDDRNACGAAVRMLAPVSHLIYAAVAEAPGLIGGWYDNTLIATNGRMFANILDPVSAMGALVQVSLLQGTKAYGAHHHAIEVPAHEDSPRDNHPNFYWLHEDHVRLRAGEAGFRYTIFRPQVLLGGAPGAAMNPVAAVGAYAAVCQELGRPFVFPGFGHTVQEFVDSGLLAEALHWAATSPAAADQIFNITNGDVMVVQHAWPYIAASLKLSADGQAPPSLAAFFAEPEVTAAWARLVARHGLKIATLPEVLGQSHHYLDMLLSSQMAAVAVPPLLSTIKIRQAGFGACRNSRNSLLFWIHRMTELRLLPPLV